VPNDWTTIDPALAGRETPAWFRDAKLGIFVHWGVYSVPGWAPPTGLFSNRHELGWEAWFKRNPYAEWYENSLRIPGSPTAEHHRETYGDAPYSDFAASFAAANANWEPADWADLFQRAGAKYTVLTTKHHDGYSLWPTSVPNPYRENWHSERDLVGDLAEAVRAKGLRFGTYYSGGYDWSWFPNLIDGTGNAHTMVFRQDEAYIAYLDAQWRELIERYDTDLLWNDIGVPAGQDVPRLFRDYLARVPDGVIDNRFRQCGPDGTIVNLPPFDFTTPEYASESEISAIPFESCRGIGYSFGYNQLEDESTFIGVEELIHFFVDLVSKNGNLLLNVGPMADGTIQPGQVERLEALGDWLAINGAAIYGSRPWERAEGATRDGRAVRFTLGSDGAIYAIVLGEARPGELVIPELPAEMAGNVTLLGHEDVLDCRFEGSELRIRLTDSLPAGPAHTFRLGG
jgi:alpha-L-fucosidase